MSKKILFLGSIGVYHTLLAAHLYLGTLKSEDFNALEFWGDQIREKSGEPILAGYDADKNPVYCLGAGLEVTMTQKSIQQLAAILNRHDLLVQTIFIKREKSLYFLHQMINRMGMNRWVDFLIKSLLKQEMVNIRQQINEFRKQVRFV